MKRSGTVTWFNEIKGFGFLRDDDAGDDVYVDYAAVEREGFRTLHPGERVEFRRVEEGGGVKAAQVRIPAPASAAASSDA